MAAAFKLVKIPELYLIDPVAMEAPPVPGTSKLNVPPLKIIFLLMITLPPVLGSIPKKPEDIVKSVGPPAILIVKKSADKILPAVVCINGIAAPRVSTFVELLVANETELVPDAILIAPMVWVGTLLTLIVKVALKERISVIAGKVLGKELLVSQLVAIW